MKVHAPPIYCALKYLLQWLREERPQHLALRRDLTPNSVRAALAFFQVARAFPGIHRPGQAQFVGRAPSGRTFRYASRCSRSRQALFAQ